MIFNPGETWADWLIGERVIQAAPARVARGTELPEVKSKGEVPFVIASKHSNGAVAIATLARINSDRGIHHPLANVTIDIGKGNHPVGIFGRYECLTLKLSQSLGNRRVLVQDLASDSAVDITEQTGVKDSSLTFSGSLIEQAGLSASAPGDLSEPGLVLMLRC